MKRRGVKLLICWHINNADINNWYSTATRYAKCDVISGENKKFKLKYLINKTLEHGGTKELVLQF